MRESIFGLDRSEERSLAIYPNCTAFLHVTSNAAAITGDTTGTVEEVGGTVQTADATLGTFTGAANVDTITDNHATDNDVLDLSALLDANFGASSNVADFVRVTQIRSSVTVQVDPDGVAGGANFSASQF